MPDGFDDVAGPRLALRANHARTFGDAAERLAEVGGAAHEGHVERELVDVVLLVGRRQHLRLVDVVHAERLEDLRLREVADSRLGHHGNGDGCLDLLDHLGVAHAGHATVTTDVGRHALERHHRAGAGVLGDPGLFGVDDVHDDAALEHFGEAALDLHRATRCRGGTVLCHGRELTDSTTDTPTRCPGRGRIRER